MKERRPSVEPILSGAFGVPVRVTRSERIGPWFVVRCRLAPAPDIPRTVIVKSLREHPADLRTDPAQVFTEFAALSFLQDLGLSVAPRVLACDLASGVLVLEDLAPRVPLAGLLWRGKVAADEGLVSFARTIGELHTGTAGVGDRYYEQRGALGPVDPQRERQRFAGWGWARTRRHAEHELGATLSARAEAELARVHAGIAEPGPFLVLSNGDSGSNNFLIDGTGDGRIIDWEFAGYRHALTDVACLSVPGPMWIRVGDPAGPETEYRRVLADAIPHAADDASFGSGLAAACITMATERLSRFPTLDSRAPGDDSRLQMVSTLESAAAAAERHRSFPSLSGWLRQVGATLRRRWSDANVDFSMIPPYTMRR